MKKMNRLVSLLLAVILWIQLLPLNALAEATTAISEAELQKAVQTAGLQITTENGVTVVKAKESGYHRGMKPEEGWDARMLLDWLDDMLKTDIYNVTHTYAQAQTTLNKMETQDPLAYARLTGAPYTQYAEDCRKYTLAAEEMEQEARFLHNRVGETIVQIEQNAQILLNDSGNLFDFEKTRMAEQTREALETLEGLEEDILALAIEQMLVSGIWGQAMLDGKVDPGFSAWIREVMETESTVKVKSASISTSEEFGTLTRMSRLSPISSALAADDSSSVDVKITVLQKSQFAIAVHGEGNKPLVGVEVTVQDLNGSMVKTVKTEKPDYGIALFDCADFKCDDDLEMELAVTVDGSSLGC